jgi:hypothetical protein
MMLAASPTARRHQGGGFPGIGGVGADLAIPSASQDRRAVTMTDKTFPTSAADGV